MLQRLSEERYGVVLSRDHPLAGEQQVTRENLANYPEILHRDRLYSEKKEGEKRHLRHGPAVAATAPGGPIQ